MDLRKASARAALLLVGAAAVGGAAQAETQLARGEYLVRVVAACGNCHTPFGPQGPDMSRELGGRLVEKNEAFEAWAPNITPDPETGIGAWTDAELKTAIRDGLRPDGSVIGPPMPFTFYKGLGDADLDAIVAFLRSVAPVKNETPVSVYNFPLPPNYGPAVESVTPPERAATPEYGEYLAGPVGHCMECHTKLGPAGPMISTHLGAGGNEFHGPWGTSVAANLTPHADGIAGRSDDELVTMIRLGLRDGKPMLPPMGYPHYAAMTDEDALAIVAYLRTLPPLPTPA